MVILSQMRAYEEIIDFIAAGTTSRTVVDFQPPEAIGNRVAELVSRKKTEGLTADEASVLNHHLTVEHLIRMAQARALRLITNG